MGLDKYVPHLFCAIPFGVGVLAVAVSAAGGAALNYGVGDTLLYSFGGSLSAAVGMAFAGWRP